MGSKYRESLEFLHRREKKILKRKKNRKNKKYKPYKSNLLSNNNLIPNIPIELNLLKTKRIKSPKMEITLPISFSVKNNAKETISIIKEITNYFFEENDLELIINCNETIDMDLSALILLDIVIVRGTKYLNKRGYKCFINGYLPKDLVTKEIFIYSGLPKHLKLLEDKTDNKIEILDPFLTIDDTNLETHRIIEYYNNCLKRNGYKLNDKGKIFFNSLINEIVDNARIHNGYKEIFYCGGFYSDRTKKGQLSIISFGNTIYESLNSETTSDEIKEKINDYISCQKNFYDISYNEEMAWTVYALQYKISRFNNEITPDRGTGTIHFMEAFMTMGRTINNDVPEMVLISGNTNILFDGTYTLKDEKIGGEDIKVIAFNDNNNLKEKPNKNYVKDMGIKFPGVIINVEFYVDKDYLERFKEEENE